MATSLVDAERIRHELEVHAIELEMQNEELRLARIDTEAALRRYAELFELAPVGYLVLDADGVIREANLEAAALLSTSRPRVVGAPLGRFFHGAGDDSFSRFLSRILTKPDGARCERETCELTHVAPGRSPRDMQLVGSPVLGTERRALIAMQDVTAQKRAERALREEGLRKDAFLATLSHELRNPLGVMTSSLAVLRRGEAGGEPAHAALAVLGRQVEHLGHIVDDLLDVTRIARGKVVLQPRLLELGSFVARVTEDHRSAFELSELTLDVVVGEDPLWVEADRTRLGQVIANLLSNAQKFTPPKGHVEVALRRVGDEIRLSVRDDGIGIPTGMLERVFEPFVQGAQGVDRGQGGVGLGLAMVKGLVELHRGSVRGTSDGFGKGAQFDVFLPRAPAPRAMRSPAAPTPQRARRHVLIIDDNVEAASMLKVLLELEGHVVTTANDGPSGVAQAKSLDLDIIFCDIGLPGMDGYEVARTIRAELPGRAAYLVALSGYALPADRQDALAAGYNEHLAKPASIEELDRVLQISPLLSPHPHPHLPRSASRSSFR